MVTEDLKINPNPFIYPGHDESKPGEYKCFKPIQTSIFSESFRVTDAKMEDDDYFVFLVEG